MPYEKGEADRRARPGARLLTIGGGGHLMCARDPVAFAGGVRDFVGPGRRARPGSAAWPASAVPCSSRAPSGSDTSSATWRSPREMRALHGDLEIDWFTVHPASAYLEREGERLHPVTRLANESRHFEAQAGEHDLHAFFALRTMDELMARNFLVFAELLEQEHYDIVVGDESWEVDYHYHENPELKRQPFVFLTDFVGCLPMEEGNAREAYLCADRNADEIEHVARYPGSAIARSSSAIRRTSTELPFGPGLPVSAIGPAQFRLSGYVLPFDPTRWPIRDALRARHGYGAMKSS